MKLRRTTKAKPILGSEGHNQTECELCTSARETGGWGPKLRDGTHCADCGMTWTAKRDGHCTRCHRQFGSDEWVWNIHLRLDGPCLDPTKIIDHNGNPIAMYGVRGQLIRWSSPDQQERLRLMHEEQKAKR